MVALGIVGTAQKSESQTLEAESSDRSSAASSDASAPSPFDEIPLRDRSLLYVSGLSSDDLLNMRSGASTSARILNQLDPGSWALPDLERQAASNENDNIAWVKVWYCGEEGWVAAKFVTEQPDDFPKIQDCPGGLRDPIEEIAGISAPVDMGDIASIPDETSLQTQRLAGEEDAAARRDLGQSILSTDYVSCVALAQRVGEGDNVGSTQTRLERERIRDRINTAITRCLATERDRWRDDMDIAYRLLVGSVDIEQLRLARDEQRSWAISRNELCVDPALSNAAPFTRLHLETCELKMYVDRTVALEASIKSLRSSRVPASASATEGVSDSDPAEN